MENHANVNLTPVLIAVSEGRIARVRICSYRAISTKQRRNMTDWKAIISIVALAIVTVLSFVILPESAGLHDKLAYGLLSLSGVYGIGAGAKFMLNKMAGK